MASSIERRPEIRGVGVLQVGYMGAVGGLLMAIVFGAIMAIVVVATGAAGSGAPVGQSLAGGAIGFAWNDLWDNDGSFVGTTDPVGVDGNISGDPAYVNAPAGDFELGAGSACIDTGNPDLLDVDGTRADIGAYGGPNAP